MQTEGLTTETHSCYARNMEALAARQPALAAIVTATATPDYVVPATGRDGTPSYRIGEARSRSQSTGGRSRWFGGSSMPGISAREIFAGFVSDGRSVILPGVLSGVEPLVLAEKLPAHAAVFAVEEDPVLLKLALCAHDYAGLIATGRIVFVLSGAENHTVRLQDFFEAHPGYELPIHLLPVPQRSSARIADLQSEVEAAGRAIVDVHARVVAGLVERLGSRSRGVLPGAPSVAVLGVDPMPGSLMQVRRIERALTQLTWPHSTCVPNAPERCHLAARIAAVERVSADMILLVNTAFGLSGAELPADLPVVSWHLPGSRHLTPGSLSPDRNTGFTGSRQVYFASSLSVHDELVAAGCRPNMIEHCGLAADTVAFRPLDSQGNASGADIAVIADLADASAEGCNITLDSHVALWQALAEAVRRHVDEDLSTMSEALMAEAERLSHAAVREPEVRARFMRLLQDRLVPVVRAGTVVEALRGAGHRLSVWGRNWPGLQEAADVRRGPTGKPALPTSKLALPVPDEEGLNQIFNAVRVVVIADPLPEGVQTALDAIAAGSAVVCSGGVEPFEKEHPRLASIRECLHLYKTTGELVRLVDSLANVSRKRDENVLTATELIRGEHSVARRLKQIADTIRRCLVPTGTG